MAIEREQINSLLSKLPPSLKWVSIFLAGAFSWETAQWVRSVSDSIPRSALSALSLLLLSLLSLVSILAFRLWTQTSNQGVFIWYPAFGAKWKYWQGAKRFDPRPYCVCCREPLPWKSHGTDGEKRHLFSCPSKSRDYSNSHFLQPDDDPEKFLSIPEALKLLPRKL